MVAVLGAVDHAGAVQDAQVLGDVLLAGAEGMLKLGDGGLAVAEAIQELDPHRFGEHAEPLRDQLDEGVGERMLKGGGADMGSTIPQL